LKGIETSVQVVPLFFESFHFWVSYITFWNFLNFLLKGHMRIEIRYDILKPVKIYESFSKPCSPTTTQYCHLGVCLEHLIPGSHDEDVHSGCIWQPSWH
jgi:hypothetical protein